MEYSLCQTGHDISNQFGETCPFPKKLKIDDTISSQHQNDIVQNVISDWISEYKNWYKATFGENVNTEHKSKYIEEFSKIENQFPKHNLGKETEIPNFQYQHNVDQPVWPNIADHINLPPLNIRHEPEYFRMYKTKNIKQKSSKVGYWGPLLRYGTYGVFHIYPKPIKFNRVTLMTNNNESKRISLSYPLEPPLRIRMPRQAMIYTIQSKLKPYLSDLRRVESDPILQTSLNYSQKLEQVTTKCGTCPKYLYTQIQSLPLTERGYFTLLPGNAHGQTFLSLDGSLCLPIPSTNCFFACELLLSDIIIAQGFALWKRRAKEICSRKAFDVLQRPCFLVGSTRYWYGTDYMTACITESPTVAPVLPPFLTDPTEPLYKKDEKINESDPNENFEILNPKPLSDFWLLAPTLKSLSDIKLIDPVKLLNQSAEFSQMTLSYELESCWDESFSCTVMIDKSLAIKVDSLASLEQACQAASLVLVDKLVDKQPIVVVQEAYHQQYDALEKDNEPGDNSFLAAGLIMSADNPIDFIDLSDHITPETCLSSSDQSRISSREYLTSVVDLEYLLTIYAQSSLISPLRIPRSSVCPSLWMSLAATARQCGLIIMTALPGVSSEYGNSDHHDGVSPQGSGSVIFICKQIGHSRMKALLLREGQLGVFSLLSAGTLSGEYQEFLNQFLESTDDCPSDGTSLYTDIIHHVSSDSIPGLDF